MSADDVVVRLEKVTKVYQQDSIAVHALCGVSLEIHEGDFAVLVGPSGSGKTTLLNVIGGLDTPTAGRIWVAGTETGRMSKSELSEMRLRKIGFVFQEFNLVPVLSAVENVEFVMLLQGVAEAQRRARSYALLKELGTDISRVLHGEEEFEHFKPIRPGQTYLCRGRITDIYEKPGKSGPMAFVLREITVTDSDNDIVAVMRQTTVVRL